MKIRSSVAANAVGSLKVITLYDPVQGT